MNAALPLTPPSERASRYARMNGIGNAILVVDRRGQGPIAGEAARRLAGRPDFAFDQLMAVGDPRSAGTDAFVEIFNGDGSRAGACGNGTRCVAWFLLEGTHRLETLVETDAGLLACHRDGAWRFTVDMGAPRLGWRDIPLAHPVDDTRAFALPPPDQGFSALGPASAVGMGNPHVVFWLPADAPLPDLDRLGPALERHPVFPDRVNVSFARALARDRIVLDVWERGAGRTQACGSAACATLVSGVRRGLTDRRATIRLPGGVLDLVWREADDHVLMSGPVELESVGLLEVEGAGAAA